MVGKELGKHAQERYALITATCLDGFDAEGFKSATMDALLLHFSLASGGKK